MRKGDLIERDFEDGDNVYSVSCTIKNFHSKDEEQFFLIGKVMKAVSYGRIKGIAENVELEMSEVLFAWDTIMGIVPDDKLSRSGNKIYWTVGAGTLYKINNIHKLLNTLGSDMIELVFLEI